MCVLNGTAAKGARLWYSQTLSWNVSSKRNGFPKRENSANTTNQMKTEQWPALSYWGRMWVLSISPCLPRHRNQSKNSTSVADTSSGLLKGHLGREFVPAISFSPCFISCQDWMSSVELNMNMKVKRTHPERKLILLQVSTAPPPSD